MLFVKVSVMLLLALSASSSTLEKDCKNKEGKCTHKEPRENLYPTCMFEKKRSTLWCNYSNYTRIPDPNDVEKEIYQSCKSATALDISDSCIRKLNRDDLAKYPNLMTLKSGENLISTIQARLFEGNSKLETLDFCTNAIKTIQPEGFRGLTNLQTLILDNNDLKELNEGMFRGLSSLKKLSIHNNDIAVLHGRTFSRLRSLEVLILTGNRIAHIDEDAFVGLESLTTLQLDENKLRDLGRNTFSRLPRLQILSLSYNDFVTLPDFGENTLVNLQTLNLGHNMLEEIKSSNIANLSKLQNLSLENNSLHTLPEDLHVHTPNLRYLNISKNHFVEIGEFAFTKLSYLETLDLRDNGLTTPYAEWFSRVIGNGLAIPNVTTGNEWECDCDIIQYQQFLSKLDKEWQKALRIECHSPKSIVFYVSKVLDERVVEAVDASRGCTDTKPYTKSQRTTNSPYPYSKIDPITYQPKSKRDTTPRETTTVPSTTRELMHGAMGRQYLSTEKVEGPETDTAAIILIGIALALFLGIVAGSAFCIIRKGKDKADEPEYKHSFREDSRTDVEAGLEEKLIPSTIPTVRVSSSGSVSERTQSESLQGSANGDDRSVSSNAEITADETYMTMQNITQERTVPKEVGSGNLNHDQHLQPLLLGARRQPDGASFKKSDA